jgi:hypothetical protein
VVRCLCGAAVSGGDLLDVRSQAEGCDGMLVVLVTTSGSLCEMSEKKD